MLKFQLVNRIKKQTAWLYKFNSMANDHLFSIFKEKEFTYGDSKQEAFVQHFRIILRGSLLQIIYREKKGIVLNFLSSFKNA